MKKVIIATFLSVLVGCATTDYSEFKMGTAELSNIEFKENIELSKGMHNIELSFDYVISDFHQDKNLYNCTVQFLNIDNSTSSSFRGSGMPCKLVSARGQVALTWPTPLDKSLSNSKEMLVNMRYPISFFIAIHQKTGSKTNQIIGKSPIELSSVEL